MGSTTGGSFLRLMESDERRPGVLLVGVVPPPVHGQSLATRALFDADYPGIRKIIVEIRSSTNLANVGKLSLRKALRLIPIVLKTWWMRIVGGPRVLYYAAGSGAWVPFIRDVVFLSLCRPLFRTTLIHYHSGDLVDFLSHSRIRTILGSWIYGRGAWTIRLGEFCPAPVYPGNRVFNVPNGIDPPSNPPAPDPHKNLHILFLGNLYEHKGVADLIEGVRSFANTFEDRITLSLIGAWPDEETRVKISTALASLPPNVECPEPAPAYGDEKWTALASSDIFVFPSYYRSENFPLVVIEAMAASLPVIATEWRGLKSLVDDGITGLLTPPRDPAALSERLAKLANSPGLRRSMGKAGRDKYERELTAPAFIRNIGSVLSEAVHNS